MVAVASSVSVWTRQPDYVAVALAVLWIAPIVLASEALVLAHILFLSPARIAASRFPKAQFALCLGFFGASWSCRVSHHSQEYRSTNSRMTFLACFAASSSVIFKASPLTTNLGPGRRQRPHQRTGPDREPLPPSDTTPHRDIL